MPRAIQKVHIQGEAAELVHQLSEELNIEGGKIVELGLGLVAQLSRWGYLQVDSDIRQARLVVKKSVEAEECACLVVGLDSQPTTIN